ncbi:MAG: hypothetical protein HW390_1969 [Candidatus Brocadiaceae bacterium]|nr:hypothetical protein [Candidatus Brocadiaceae bacterium]
MGVASRPPDKHEKVASNAPYNAMSIKAEALSYGVFIIL